MVKRGRLRLQKQSIPCGVLLFDLKLNTSKFLQHVELKFHVSCSGFYFVFSAQILIPLEEIKSLDLFAKWFSLVPVSPTSRGEMGSLRIRARYLHEIIMPEDKYSTLKEVRRLE